jgi:dihydroorotase
MEFLIKNALIVHPPSPYHLSKKDILIDNGVIKEIKNNLVAEKAKIIQSTNLHCSIGWMDIGTHLGEPGYEYRETTDSLSAAASAGGYTAVAPFPSTDPIIQAASDIQYLVNRFEPKLQDVYPIAALSKNKEGKDLTEMRDLITNGCKGFTDGMGGKLSSGLLLRALQYISDTDAIIIDFPYSEELAYQGQIHEGKTSIRLGLPGIPDISETIPLQRTIEIIKYVNAKILIHGISSSESLVYLKKARKKLAEIFCSVPYLNLISSEEDLEGFNSNFKVLPPIREKSTAKKLVNGLVKGQIDAIVSNHIPLEEEKKLLEFSYVTPGAIGLETCYAALNTYLGPEVMLDLIPKLGQGPRNIFKIDIPEIKIGSKANLTFFDPTLEWKYTKPKSLSRNSPFLDKAFTGKVLGVINGRKHHLT